MRKTRAKLSWEGGDVAPFPRSPASPGDMGMNQTTAGVPIENCLIRGVQSAKLGTNREQIGNKLPKNTREIGGPTHT